MLLIDNFSLKLGFKNQLIIMNYISKFAFLIVLTSLSVIGQQKITVEEIFTGAFRTKGMEEVRLPNE